MIYLELLLRLPLLILNHLVLSVLKFIMVIIGWIIIPIVALLKRYHYVASRFEPSRQILVFKDKFMYPWSSDEDGINWHANEETRYEGTFKQIIMWSAKRNAVGNSRFVFPFKLTVDSSKIKYIASSNFNKGDENNIDKNFWYIAWQGNRGCFRLHFNRLRIWIGTKLYPRDQDYIEPEWRKSGTGITIIQFKMMRDYFVPKK
jgi:hypothetical protein